MILFINTVLSVAHFPGSKTPSISHLQIYQTTSRNFPRKKVLKKYYDVATMFGFRDYFLNKFLPLCRNPVPTHIRGLCSIGQGVRISSHVYFLIYTPVKCVAKQLSEKWSPSPWSNVNSEFRQAPPKESQQADSWSGQTMCRIVGWEEGIFFRLFCCLPSSSIPPYICVPEFWCTQSW